MGACANNGRSCSCGVASLDPRSNSQCLHLRKQISSKQIVLKPLQNLSVPTHSKINTSNTRASTNRQTSLLDVIDQYNEECRVVDNLIARNQMNLMETESHFVQDDNQTLTGSIFAKNRRQHLKFNFFQKKEKLWDYRQKNDGISPTANPPPKDLAKQPIKQALNV